MIAADLASAAVLVVVVAIALASGGPGIIGLVCAIVVLAIGQAVFRPALQSVLPTVVEDTTLLPAANGLLDATARIARLLGPGVVALLVGMVPVVHFLTIDAATFVASAAALVLIRRLRPPEPVTSRSVPRAPVLSSIIRGYRATARHPLLFYYLTVSAPLNGAWYTVFYLCLPLLITRTGLGSSGGGLGAYGMILSAYGCGNLAATVFLGGRRLPARPQFQMLCGNLLWGCGVLLLAAANLLPVEWRLTGFAAAAALSAIGGPMQDIPTAVLRQTRLSPHDRPATMRASMTVAGLGVLAAMLLTPMAITRFGIAPIIVGCGVLYLVIAAVGLARFARWHDADAKQVSEPEPAMT